MDDARAGRSVFLGDVNYSGFPSDDDSGCALDEYAWVPPGITAEQVGEHDKYLYFVSDKQNLWTLYLGSCNVHGSNF